MVVLSIIFGVLLIIAGFTSLFNPIASTLSFGMFLGMFIGVMLILSGFSGLFTKMDKKPNVWKIIFNVLIIVLGILILTDGCGVWQDGTGVWNSTSVFVGILSVIMLIIGICRVVMAFQLRKEGAAMGLVLASGIITIIAAIVIMIFPLCGLFFMNIMISIIVIMMGFNLIATSAAN